MADYRFNIPDEIKFCLDTLWNAGYRAYLVGGCVRDLLLGLIPHDFDITSDAEPEKIFPLFERVIDTGMKHGTVTVIINHKPIEITRMRIDGEYKDSRRPESVLPASNIYEDLKRRDFTINAMAYSTDEGIIDPYGGQSDLKSGIIKAVGDPEIRFSEDALRIMRAFRFAAQLGFDIENETLNAALNLSGLLQKISTERIFTELMKSLSSEKSSKITPLISNGGLEFLNINKTNDLQKLDLIPPVRELRFALFLYLCGSDIFSVCTALKADKALCAKAKLYYDFLNNNAPENSTQLKKLMQVMNADDIFLALSAKEILENKSYENLNQILKTIVEKKEPFSLRDLKINGEDIINEGISGKAVGLVLNRLLEEVLQKPELNTKEQLLTILKEISISNTERSDNNGENHNA